MQIEAEMAGQRADGLSYDCLIGNAANRRVLLGFAPANVLHAISFADVLDEETGRGYQRKFNAQHSLDFRRYIQTANAATIPLTFNLRPRTDDAWRVTTGVGGRAKLRIGANTGRVLAQVDCQHRLGHLSDLATVLPFMCFIGLTDREEMEVFNIINGKARGLSRSLLDFHDAQLSDDLGTDRPELFIALYLKSEPSSPWHNQLDLGGKSSSGMTRRASLRTMQKAIKRFLSRTRISGQGGTERGARVILDFWSAVSIVLHEAWRNPRKHMLCKGVGVYALMDIAADLYLDCPRGVTMDRTYFCAALGDFATGFDWSTQGPLQGLGGESGVKAAVELIREARRKSMLKVVRG
jgi:DGQHR domain-containing protein